VALSNLRGKQGLKVCKYGEGDWVMPAPEIPVLILSDLGMLEASGVLRKQWLRFGCALKAAGIQPFVLAPVSPQHIDPELGSYYHIALWGRSSRLLRQRQRVEVDNYPQLEELLALLSPAIRIEPELLRAVRHLLPDAEFDTGIEAAFWQHSDMDVSPVACALRPESVEKHRINFKVQSPNLQRDVLKLIRQHHAHLFAAIMHEETLIWAELVSDELVMEFQQEIQQANIFLRKTAKMFYSQREHLGDSYKAYGKRLVNRAHKGLRQQHDALAVVAAVYSMDELREKRSVLPTEGINRQEWERVLAQGNKQRRECVLYQYGDELRLAENNADTPLGSFVAEMTLTNDLLSVQTETVDGETSELYFQGNTDEIFLTSLEQNIQQLTLQSGDETLILRGFNKPDWVHRMGRDSKGLWIEFSQHNKEYRIYWPVWGSELGYDEYGLYADIIINGITQRCRWIPPGEFLMGSPKKEIGRVNHEVQHSVSITHGYWLADTACTQSLWEAVMGNNPAYFTGDKDNPVEQVSWDNAQDFFKRLSALIPGLDAHLPTEAQWEYACRAGTITPFSIGENISPIEVNYDGYFPHREETVPVKSLPPNPWGLYEMHGNVWEWCEDWYNTYSAKPVVDPIGKTSFIRVLRGGAVNQNSRCVRSAHRYGSTPDHCGNTFGFRFVLGKVTKSTVKAHRKPSVYVSYSWTAERANPLIDELGHACTAYGLSFTRDGNRLRHGDLIRNFMDELNSNGNIILILSRSYFKSEYCMYELLQIWRNRSLWKNIHPILVGDIQMDDVNFQLELINYWERKTKDLQYEISKQNQENIIPLTERLVVFTIIFRDISQIVGFFSDINAISLYELRQQKFQPLLKNIAMQSRIDELEREIKIFKSSSVSDYKDISEWLSVNKESLVDRMYNAIIEEFGNLITFEKNIADSFEVKIFKINLSHFIEQLDFCLLAQNTDLIDEPVFEIFIEKRFYEFAFSLLIKRVPDHVADESVRKLKYYVDYLVERL
jgi:hypothetical protein